VLNPNIILTRLDVVIGARFFELEFEIERYEPTLGAASFLKRSGYEGDDKANEEKNKDRDVNNLGSKSMGSTSRSVELNVGNSGKSTDNFMTDNYSLEDFDDDDTLDEEWEISADHFVKGQLVTQRQQQVHAEAEQVVQQVANAELPSLVFASKTQVAQGQQHVQVEVVQQAASAVLPSLLCATKKQEVGSLATTQDVVVPHRVTGELPTQVETSVNPTQLSRQLQVQRDSSAMSLDSLIEKALQGINEKNVVATGEIICTPPPRVAMGKAASTPSRHSKRREGSTLEHSVE
jgi:hypothetical protein